MQGRAMLGIVGEAIAIVLNRAIAIVSCSLAERTHRLAAGCGSGVQAVTLAKPHDVLLHHVAQQV
jgi:hypothetical protein